MTFKGLKERKNKNADYRYYTIQVRTIKKMTEILNEDYKNLFKNSAECMESSINGQFYPPYSIQDFYYADKLINNDKDIKNIINLLDHHSNYNDEEDYIHEYERLEQNIDNPYIIYFWYKKEKTDIFTFHYSELKNKLCKAIQNSENFDKILFELKVDKYKIINRQQIIKMSLYQIRSYNYSEEYITKKLNIHYKIFDEDYKIEIIKRFIQKYCKKIRL